MTLSQRKPELEWNSRIQDYLESPCVPAYRKIIVNHPFKTNMDFIKTALLHKLRLIYFMTEPSAVKEQIGCYIMKFMLENPSLHKLREDESFRKYLTGIINDMIDQAERCAEKYIKYDLMISVKHFGYAGKDIYESMLIHVCEKHCEALNFKDFIADKAKLDNILVWTEKNFASRKTTQNAQIISSYNKVGMFFGVVMLAGMALSYLKDYALLGFAMSVPSAILGGLYFRHYRHQNQASINECHKALVDMAMDLVSIKLKKVKEKIKLELKVNLDITPLRVHVATEENKPKPISGHSYAKILPPLRIQVPAQLVVQPVPATTSTELQIITENHIRFLYHGKMVNAYLSQADLPNDNGEAKAITKAFQKGLMPVSKQKSVHAIVQDGKDSFKIRTSYDARMRGNYSVIDDKTAQIIFNNYDANAHNAKRTKKSSAPVLTSVPAFR